MDTNDNTANQQNPNSGEPVTGNGTGATDAGGSTASSASMKPTPQPVPQPSPQAGLSQGAAFNGVTHEDMAGIAGRLDDVVDALGDIAIAEKKHAKQAKISAVGSVLLFLAFTAVFICLTPGMFKLLGNLNSTLTQLSTTVSEVNTLVASANKTVTGVNGIIDETLSAM